MAETTFQMTPATLARAIASGAARERRRAAKIVEDASDVALGEGHLALGHVLAQVAESIRSSDVRAPIPDEPEQEPINEPIDEDVLPEVRHMDDFAEGSALVRMGAHQRTLTGYNGASGHLRD